MPWKEKGLKTMREEFVKRVLAHEKSKSALCREYGISRPTGDKWIARYLAEETMEDHQRVVKTPANRTEPKMEQSIVAYRKKYPAIGAVKIHRMMEDEGIQNLPSARTINNIFLRNGLITREASLAATPYQRFEKSYPNEMLQVDFKGSFQMANGKRCHPLNVVDDYSRFNLCCQPLMSETYAEVKPVMTRIFQEYGLPFSILCDNGNPWGTAQVDGFTCFEVWMMEHGVLTLHGRPLHPQTQGKQEKFNGSLKRECLKQHQILNQADAAQILSEYREFYNNKRPHHALGLEVPASIYMPSKKQYCEEIKQWEYPQECTICRTDAKGYFSIRKQRYFLSNAFGDKEIALRESSKSSSLINLYFRQFVIGQIDIEESKFTYKRAYLIDGDPRHRSI